MMTGYLNAPSPFDEEGRFMRRIVPAKTALTEPGTLDHFNKRLRA